MIIKWMLLWPTLVQILLEYFFQKAMEVLKSNKHVLLVLNLVLIGLLAVILMMTIIYMLPLLIMVPTTNVDIFFGYDNGTFINQTTYPTTLNSNAFSIAVADFNNDNQLDTAVINNGIGSLSIFCR